MKAFFKTMKKLFRAFYEGLTEKPDYEQAMKDLDEIDRQLDEKFKEQAAARLASVEPTPSHLSAGTTAGISSDGMISMRHSEDGGFAGFVGGSGVGGKIREDGGVNGISSNGTGFSGRIGADGTVCGIDAHGNRLSGRIDSNGNFVGIDNHGRRYSGRSNGGFKF